MRVVATIPEVLERTVRSHLFQDGLEQAAFLFARPMKVADQLRLGVVDAYLIPSEGWEAQSAVYLEMSDAERSRVMSCARAGNFAILDCHSHPHSGENVCFSSSDRYGITEFASYARWKLDGKPYTAMVWGEGSIDAVTWHDDYREPTRVDQVIVLTTPPMVWTPRGTWFHRSRLSWREQQYGR